LKVKIINKRSVDCDRIDFLNDYYDRRFWKQESYSRKNNPFYLQEYLLIKAGFTLESSDKWSAVYTIEDKMINKIVNKKKEGYHINCYRSTYPPGFTEKSIDLSTVGLESFYEYKNDKECAVFQFEYFKGDTTFLSAKYLDGQLHGEFIVFDNYPRPMTLGGFFSFGKKEGYWTEEDGRGYYENGLKEGYWTEEDGFGLYKKGVKTDHWYEISGNGSYEDGKRFGEWIIYENEDAPDAPLKRPIKVIFENGKKIINDGQFAIDYDFRSDQKWAQGQFKDGNKTGKWVYYYDSGEICSEIDYDEGNIIRERNILLDKEGFKKSDITIEKNKKHSIYFHKNGKVRRTIDYKYDKTTKRFMKNGLLVKYDLKGKKIDEIKYLDDEEI